MNHLEFIKDAFDDAMKSRGYGINRSKPNRGYHSTSYRKVVDGEFLFCPVLYIEPDVLKSGKRNLGFHSGVEYIFELEKRIHLSGDYFSLYEVSCCFHFGCLHGIEYLDKALARAIKNNPWFAHHCKWSLGGTMADAHSFVQDTLALLMQVLFIYEQMFKFPAPLDKFTISDLQRLRSAKKPAGSRPGPDEDSLCHGLEIYDVDKLVALLSSFYRKNGNMTVLAELKDFLRAAPPPGPQIVYFQD